MASTDVAQYESADRRVFASAFVFLASHADAALVALGTDRAIHIRYGDVALISDTLASAAGLERAAIRRVYTGGRLDGEMLTTAASYIRADRWIVSLRVSGPPDRQADIEQALDALTTDVRFIGGAHPVSAATPVLAAACPEPITHDARLIRGSGRSMEDAIVGSVFGGAEQPAEDSSAARHGPARLAFPANGATPMCIAATLPSGRLLYRPAGTNVVSERLVLIDDAADALTVEPNLLGHGFQLKRYEIGHFDTLGTFESMPTPTQLDAIIDHRDQEGSRVIARTVLHPISGSDVQIITAPHG